MNGTKQTEQRGDSMSIVATNETSGTTKDSGNESLQMNIRLASSDAAQAPAPPRRRSLAGAWIAFVVVVAVLVGFAVLTVYLSYIRPGK